MRKSESFENNPRNGNEGLKNEVVEQKENKEKTPKEILDNFAKVCEYIGSGKEREELLENSAYWRKIWEEGIKDRKEWQDKYGGTDMASAKEIKVNEEVLGWVVPYELKNAFELIPEAIEKMAFEEGLKILPDIIKRIDGARDEQEKVYKGVLDGFGSIGISSRFARGIVERFIRSSKVTSEDIEKFAQSSLVNKISPETFIEAMVEKKVPEKKMEIIIDSLLQKNPQKADEVLRAINKLDLSSGIGQKIVENYTEGIDFEYQTIFGEKSVFAGLKDREHREAVAVEHIFDKMTQGGGIKRRVAWFDAGGMPHEDISNDPHKLAKIIEFLDEALESGVAVSGIDEKADNLLNLLDNVDSYFSSEWIYRLKEKVEKWKKNE